jgi:hypothetical protein
MSTTLYALTKNPGDIESGIYATLDADNTTIVQLFVDEDDAICYNVQLEALDQGLHVTPIDNAENIDKLCDMLGYAYTIIEPGHFVVPRIETIQRDLGLL